jgi:hypothetical protein
VLVLENLEISPGRDYKAFLIEHEDEQEREHDQTMPRKSL